MANLWYYTKNGQQMAPVAAEELKRLAVAGELKPTDLVWREGMANWVQASATPGLFPKSAAQPRSASRAEANVQPRSQAAAAPRSTKADDYSVPDTEVIDYDDEPIEDEEEEVERRPRRKKRRRKQSGPGVGLIIGMIAGGILLLGGLIAGLIFLIGFSGTSDTGSRSWTLSTNQKSTYNLTFKAKHRIEVRVNTRSGQADIDLFVFDGNNRVAWDEGLSSNCFVSFVPPTTRTYRVEVWNRNLIDMPGRNGQNSGTLEWKQVPFTGNNPVIPQPVVQNPVFNPPGNNLPPVGDNFDLNTTGVLARGQTRLFTVQMNAGTRYTIDLCSNQFDAFLKLETSTGQLLRLDDDGGQGLNSQIDFVPTQTGMYRIVAGSLGNQGMGQFTLTVRH